MASGRILGGLGRLIAEAARDLAPIALVIAFFQVVVLQQPFPNLGAILTGTAFVVLGLALFVRGLEMGFKMSKPGTVRSDHDNYS